MQDISDSFSEASKQNKNKRVTAGKQQTGVSALKDASLGHDKVEFAKKRKSQHKQAVLEQARKKRNDDFTLLMKVLSVFLIFDFVTREILFQASLPHLKVME